ncbi:hypothetical protein JW905_04125 [bacterium]|nr:hypothetical protein [candidate division CSSED10-310 bacterium]
MIKSKALIGGALCFLVVLAAPDALAYDTYVNFFWNQHQPSYLHAMSGVFEYPFARIHGVRDYYFMAAVLIDGRNDINTYELSGNEWVDTGAPTGFGFPFVHLTINLSGVLLYQLQYYVDKLGPCFDGADYPEACRFDLYPNHDPLATDWNDNSLLLERVFDLLIKPQQNFTNEEKVFILFNSSYITPRSHHVFMYPSYRALETKRLTAGGGNPDNWTEEELRDLKVWYALAAMHYYFKETNAYILKGHDEFGNEMTDVVEGIKDLGQFKTWGTPADEWFGETGETLDPCDVGGYSNGHGSEFLLDGRVCHHFTDWDAIFVAIQHYKILKYIVPIHRKLQDTICPHTGYPQIEVVTTPYSHPILPLVFDTDNYFEQAPYYDRVDAIDFQYHGTGELQTGEFGPDDQAIYPDDVYNQVALGAEQYKRNFGKYPQGMWPGEGSVGESVVYAFRRNNVKWIASGDEVAVASGHVDDTGRMYRIDEDDQYLDGDNSDAMSIWFRSETDLVGFNGGFFHDGGQNLCGLVDPDGNPFWLCGMDCDANQWAFNIMEYHVINDWGHDKFWSHCADGENVWGFFHRFGATFFEYSHLEGGVDSYGLYYRLNRANAMIPPDQRWYAEYNLQTATPSSYIGIVNGEYVAGAPMPLDNQYELEPLAHGSWVWGDFTTWMGEDNEIQAWIDLKYTREGMDTINAENFRPHPYGEPLTILDGRQRYLDWLIWDELYTVEGSDPFWWYGADQCFGSDEIFCDLFRERLVSIYVLAKKAGYDMPYPYMALHPIISKGDNVNNHHPNGAETDEDYVEDCEYPPGNGDDMFVPPLTEEPVIAPATLPADGVTPGILTLRVYEEEIETSQIVEVSVDLRPIGGDRRHMLYDDGDFFNDGDAEPDDEYYSARVRVSAGTPSGRYLLVIKAIDDTGAFSLDWAFLDVAPSFNLGVEVSMPDNMFTAGESCWVKAVIVNQTTQSYQNVNFLCALDVFGSYFWYPGWTEAVEFDTFNLPAETVRQRDIIGEFLWPSGAGSANGLRFISAMTDSSMSSVIGDVGMWTFGYDS